MILEASCLAHTLQINKYDPSAQRIIDIFNHTFNAEFNTVLIGGADEPLYEPACHGVPAKVSFRHDYISSAMHEISHWVIAGEKRRLLEDYGYWYETDGRDLIQQKAFEQVEIKPQAIELLLHYAAGLSFRVSVDNLGMPEYDVSAFESDVFAQTRRFLGAQMSDQMPSRALRFIKALAQARGHDFQNDQALYQWLSLSVLH